MRALPSPCIPPWGTRAFLATSHWPAHIWGPKGVSFGPGSFLHMLEPGFSSSHQPARNAVTEGSISCPQVLSTHLPTFELQTPLPFQACNTYAVRTQGPFRLPPSPPPIEPKPFGPFTCSSAVEHGTFQTPFRPCALTGGLCYHFHFMNWRLPPYCPPPTALLITSMPTHLGF